MASGRENKTMLNSGGPGVNPTPKWVKLKKTPLEEPLGKRDITWSRFGNSATLALYTHTYSECDPPCGKRSCRVSLGGRTGTVVGKFEHTDPRELR